ncbi:MAG: CoB--CoM heterodisulfide reductase iron-sulfur subunit A family protein [Thermoplasmata archaeon]|nr:MAG: CoB--CoM heterodisulfide reductase iron-sulfur subunit A family protein [Thermoplasmata archaeon]
MSEEKKVGAVLVVGGGIAGMQSSLDLAESGFKVYLLERSPCIGGVMAQLDKTFPTNDCAMCIMAPKLVATGRHPNIELITNTEIENLEGEPGNFKVTLAKHPRRVSAEKCTGCGVCAQECPVEAVNEFNEDLLPRSAVHINYPQAVPLTFIIDKTACIGCGICEKMCKANAIEYDQAEEEQDIYVGSIILALGFDEFNPEIKKEYGYGIYPNVVSSIEFERLLSATGPTGGMVLRPSDYDIPKKVAFIQCVGSRDQQCDKSYCSAVCCMYSIKEAIIAKEHTEGLDCHIFYMDIRTYGKEFEDYYNRAQDEYKIGFTRSRPASIREDPKTRNLIISYIENSEPKEEEFDMVILSVGIDAPKDAVRLSEKLGIELNEHNFAATKKFFPLSTSKEGIFVCGAFSSPKDIPDTVAQASAAASKASAMVSTERGTMITKREIIPEKDVRLEGPRIGVFICHCGINIGGVVRVPEVVEYARTLPNVAYAEHNLYTCSQDTQEKIKEKVKEQNLNRVIVASCTPRTHEPLFQATVSEAGLNPYLFEMANIRDQCSWVHMHEPDSATEKAKDLVRMAVAKARLLEPLKMATLGINRSALVIGGGISGMTAALGFAKQGYKAYLVEKTLELGGNLRHLRYSGTQEDPQKELASLIKLVEENENIEIFKSAEILSIEGYVGNFKSRILSENMEHEIEHGVVVVATGALEYEPTEYMYGKDGRIITQLELEQLLAEDKINPKNVIMIQCVGSRGEKVPYCSRICCTTAIKNALQIKEHEPDAKVYVLYRDIRTYGFREDFYDKALEEGITFLRFDVDSKPKVEVASGRLKVTVKEPLIDENIDFNPDFVVLSVAQVPDPNNEDLSKSLKVPLSKDGFFLEAHMKLRPVDFATEGVFLCGSAHSPKFIDESISQAEAVVSRACTILSKDYLEAEGVISIVNSDICSGCETCILVCPFDAIDKDDKGKAKVNELLCKGCGACVAACRAGAIQQRCFTDEQILSVIRSAFQEVST